MLSKLYSKLSSFLRKTTSYILTKGGHIPQSVAFIMDGNRRFATKNNLKKIKGHESGLNTLLNVLEWCINLNIHELTVFAFSIDNFNRSKEEIEGLLKLAGEKFVKLSSKGELLKENGVQICFYGNLEYFKYFDEELAEKLRKMEDDTKDNKVVKLNICFPYNSSEEIYNAIKNFNSDFNNNSDSDSDKKQEEFESNLYGGYNCNPDILIRTSGEIRLSNFLIYQCRFAMIFFLDIYWPEFSYKQFIDVIIRYNINYKSHVDKLRMLQNENDFKIFKS